MELKRFFGKLFTLIIVLTLSACSDVDERLIEIEKPSVPDTDQDSIITKNVLVEDFTGQMCQNCPDATDKLKELHAIYNDNNLIPVSIYCGLSIPVGIKGSLTTNTGEEYYKHWKFNGQPIGLVNRKGPFKYSTWGDEIDKSIKELSPIKMNISSKINEDSTKLIVDLKLIPNASVDGNLQIWVTEDNITARQKLPDGKINPNYIHNHVFRKAENGMWGEEIQLKEKEEVNKNFEIAIEDGWVAKNIHIVAFIYNDEEGVLQVVKSN